MPWRVLVEDAQHSWKELPAQRELGTEDFAENANLKSQMEFIPVSVGENKNQHPEKGFVNLLAMLFQVTFPSTYLRFIPAIHMLLWVFPDVWARGVSGDGNTVEFGVFKTKKSGREPIKFRAGGKIQARASPDEADHGLGDVVARGSAAFVKHELMLLEDTEPE